MTYFNKYLRFVFQRKVINHFLEFRDKEEKRYVAMIVSNRDSQKNTLIYVVSRQREQNPRIGGTLTYCVLRLKKFYFVD